LFIRDPAATGNGHACARVVEFVDLFPTLAARCGLIAPPGLAGRSLLPLLADPAAKWEDRAVTQILRPADQRFRAPVMGRTLRTERWRYTDWNGGAAGAELYDHVTDPNEFRNLAADPQHAAVVRELRARLEPYARSTPPTSPFTPARL
jgi:uncharacterized sulfatase